MKKILIASATVVALILSGCGSDDNEIDKDEIIDEVTNVNSLAFNNLENHFIDIRERHVHNADKETITFCAGGKVKSGSYTDGDFTITSNEVEMAFTNNGSAIDQKLTEEDSDSTFKHDEHVKFNGGDYIITSMHKAPLAVCK